MPDIDYEAEVRKKYPDAYAYQHIEGWVIYGNAKPAGEYGESLDELSGGDAFIPAPAAWKSAYDNIQKGNKG